MIPTEKPIRAAQALRMVLQGSYVRRAFWVAVVVGSLLNLVNQPEAIFGSATLVWWKLCMTYVVPFCVATYGAYSAVRGS